MGVTNYLLTGMILQVPGPLQLPPLTHPHKKTSVYRVLYISTAGKVVKTSHPDVRLLIMFGENATKETEGKKGMNVQNLTNIMGT